MAKEIPIENGVCLKRFIKLKIDLYLLRSNYQG